MDELCINEARLLESRWNSTGLLAGIEDCHQRRCCAVLLENQRLYNELSLDSNDLAQYKRTSIPLVRRMFDSNFLGYIIASVQPALKKSSLCYFNKDGVVASKAMVATQLPLKTRICKDTIPEIREQFSLDKEAELTCKLAIDYADELTEIIRIQLIKKTRLLQRIVTIIISNFVAMLNWLITNIFLKFFQCQ